MSGTFVCLVSVKSAADLARSSDSIFGTELPNGQLLVDSFAANGIPVYMPDIIKGDAVSLGDYSSGKFDLMGWLGKHGKEVTRPEIDKVIEHLKGQGVQKFAAIGYCFGESVGLSLAIGSLVREIRGEGRDDPSLPLSLEDSPRKQRRCLSLISSTLQTPRRWPLHGRPRRRRCRLGRRRRSPVAARSPERHSRLEPVERTLPLAQRG